MEFLVVNKKPIVVWVTEKDISSEWISSEYYDPKFLEIEKKFLSNKFDIYNFNEIADINRVSGFEVEKYLEIVTKGVPYLRVKNIAECFVEHEDLYHIPQYVHQKFKKSQFRKNDIAMTITGRVGTAALISKETTEYNASQDVVKISLKKGGIDPYYLTIYLNSKINHSLLSRFNSGGSRQRTLINNVREVKIPIPSSEIQKYIGDKVRKAEQLREEAKRLKKEAEEILSEKLNINYNISTSHKYTWVKSAVINDRLNSEYYNEIYNEIEQQLRKQNCKNLIDLCIEFSITVPYSKDFGEKSENNIIPMIRVKNIDEYNIDNSELLYMSKKYYNDNEKCRVSKGDILISRVGTIGRAGIYSYNEEASMGQNITKIKLKEEINKFYFLCYINSKISKILMERETNTAIQPNLTNENIKQLPVPILDYSIQQHIGEKILNYMEIETMSKQLIQEAKKDVEDLIEGNFDMSKLR